MNGFGYGALGFVLGPFIGLAICWFIDHPSHLLVLAAIIVAPLLLMLVGVGAAHAVNGAPPPPRDRGNPDADVVDLLRPR